MSRAPIGGERTARRPWHPCHLPEFELQPRGPYALALTARLAYDATRSFLDGVLTCMLEGEVVQAWQRPDGAIVVRAESDVAVERLRWVLALDDDHSEF